MLHQADLYNQNTHQHQQDVNERIMDKVRIQSMGKLTPFGNDGFTGGNRGIDYEQNRQILENYISTRGIPTQKLPAEFTIGSGYRGVLSGGVRLDVDSLVPVLDQPSYSLVQEVLRRNQENFEQNEMFAEYNDDRISETELENIEQSKVKVLDILRGITAKLTAGIKRNSEAFGLSMMEDLQQVYQELLNWGYGYNRSDLERIRVYLEEEPALIRIDVGAERGGMPINKLALDILNRIVKPMLSSSFVGTIREKKLLMEQIIEGFYKTIQPSESGNNVPPELRVESFDEVNEQFQGLSQLYQQMDDLRRRQGTQQSQRVQNEMLALKKQFDERASRLYGTLVSYAMGDIYNASSEEITKARNDFNVLPAERKIAVLEQAIREFDWDEQEIPPSYPPEMYAESESLPFSLFGDVEEVEQPLEMPQRGEAESKEMEEDIPAIEEEVSAVPRRRGRPKGSRDLAPRQPRRRQAISEGESEKSKSVREREEQEQEPEPFAESDLPSGMRGTGKRMKKSSARSEMKKAFKASQIKPETFKKFIKSVMKHFDDSNIKRI